MEKMTAFCGIVCTDCEAFIATQENDDAKRREEKLQNLRRNNLVAK